MGDDDGSGLIYGLEFQCRALCPVAADSDNVRFLVGTQSLKTDNQVHLLELDEDSRALTKTVYSHPEGEVWGLEPSPTDPTQFVSRHSCLEPGGSSCHQEATLWSTSTAEGDEDAEASLLGGSSSGAVRRLRKLCSLDVGAAGEAEQSGLSSPDVSCASYMPGQGHQVMTLVGNRLALHDLGGDAAGGSSKMVATGRLEGKGQTNLSTGTWNPHQNCQIFATVNEHNVRGWDIRTMKQAWHFENPGHQVVRCLDFNPNKQYHLATAGDDGRARFWDIRSPSAPLVTLSDHSHWVWSVRFNQFHDQLVLTTSSDCHVILSCLASISSEPHGQLVDDDEEEEGEGGAGGDKRRPVLEDGVIRTFEDHEESVYVAAWSSADPWTFASLSYDGRLVVNQVPRAVKFKILNLV